MVKPLMDKPPEPKKRTNGHVKMIRKYELITPLFGGGVKANEVDTENPIRGTAVRGQLRFWWRATRGLKYAGDWKKLKEKEDDIWGSTEGGAKITITVIESDPGKPYVVPRNRNMNVGDPRSPLGYVAFPLNQGGEKVYEGAAFTLRIDCPKSLRPDLKAALWAWETFGGIGARIRRGFGALYCTEVQLWIDGKKTKTTNWEWNYSCQNVEAEIWNHIVETFEIVDIPSGSQLTGLSRDRNHIHCTPVENNAMGAWLKLINSLKNFRQSRNLDQNNRPYGRSHWPEPEAIRDLTNQAKPGHANPIDGGNPIIKFPRAAFGLPIVFEFKDDDDRWQANPNADPKKTELKGNDYERRSSRLILRSLKCTDGYVGLAIILKGQTIPPGGLELKNAPNNPPSGAENLDPAEARRIQARIQAAKQHAQRLGVSVDYPDYNGSTDILQAFLDQLP